MVGDALTFRWLLLGKGYVGRSVRAPKQAANKAQPSGENSLHPNRPHLDVDHECSQMPLPHSEQVTLQLKPITGRTHQLRVHCAAVSGGIAGDSLYGRRCRETWSGGNGEKMNLRLHAWRLSFPHPSTHEIQEFVSEPEWI